VGHFARGGPRVLGDREASKFSLLGKTPPLLRMPHGAIGRPRCFLDRLLSIRPSTQRQACSLAASEQARSCVARQTANIEPDFQHGIFKVQCNEGLILDDEGTATDVHGTSLRRKPSCCRAWYLACLGNCICEPMTIEGLCQHRSVRHLLLNAFGKALVVATGSHKNNSRSAQIAHHPCGLNTIAITARSGLSSIAIAIACFAFAAKPQTSKPKSFTSASKARAIMISSSTMSARGDRDGPEDMQVVPDNDATDGRKLCSGRNSEFHNFFHPDVCRNIAA
jgi:hypothetical protein